MLKESLQKKPNVQLMDLSKLVPNAENPKKPLGKKYKKGLEKVCQLLDLQVLFLFLQIRTERILFLMATQDTKS